MTAAAKKMLAKVDDDEDESEPPCFTYGYFHSQGIVLTSHRFKGGLSAGLTASSL